MKKQFLLLIAAFALFSASYACDTTRIDRTNWQVLYVSSEELTGEGETNGAARYALDGDLSTFWHTQWKDTSYQYPHTLILNLNDTLDINAIAITTRKETTNGRINDFELYISNDTNQWGEPQIISQFTYPQPNKNVQQIAFLKFGAIKGRYVKLVALNSLKGDAHAMVAELNLYQDLECPATGQRNQIINFPAIGKQYAHMQRVALTASCSTNLPLHFEVINGPATICNDSLCFNSPSGIVEVAAIQNGNSTFYPASKSIIVEVINLSEIEPTVNCRFTEAYPLEMPRLYPYLLYADATIDESDSLQIEEVTFSIGDTIIKAQYLDGVYQAWWTPESYGTHNIITQVKASNGKSCSLTHQINVVKTAQTQNIKTFDGDVIDFGSIGSQWFQNAYTLPQSVDEYKQIIAYFDISCPDVSGGCDDWDRLAWVEIKAPNGEWIELFRYITPYGVPCSHSVDVTDYASLLQGNVELRMYIETWGSGGWKLDLTFEYIAGQPAYRYSYVQTLWHGTYNFGNPSNLQPIDTVSVAKHPGSQLSTIRLVSSGHGWGDNNTKNASEFYNATHHIHINGVETFEHNPWVKCNPNPDGCTGQKGTWTYSRAGWCPGSIAQIDHYDVTSYLKDSINKISYIFQESYVDYCHPNHPDCVSGKTCPDCNDTYNPMYRIGGYLIHQSSQPIGAVQGDYIAPERSDKLSFTTYPNPVDQYLFFDVNASFNDAVLLIMDYTGKILRTYYFDDEREMSQQPINLESLTDGVYYLKLYTDKLSTSRKIIVKH